MRWCKKLGSSYLLLKISIWRPILPVFPRTWIASFLISTLDSFQVVLEVSDYRVSAFILMESHGQQYFLLGRLFTLPDRWPVCFFLFWLKHYFCSRYLFPSQFHVEIHDSFKPHHNFISFLNTVHVKLVRINL